MPASGEQQLFVLAQRLREAGPEGQGLKRALMRQITEAARPLAAEISNVEHLKPYMPDRYAALLAADLSVGTVKNFGTDPGVSIRGKGRERARKVRYLNEGTINHPVYARGERKTWRWKNMQTGGMRAGFFTDACKEATPQIRSKVLEALTETARKITHG